MTLWDLIRSLIRRWPVLLVGAVLTGGLGYLSVQDDGVYWTRTEVVFLAPSSRLYPNSLKTTSEDLIITAGIVAKEITGPERITKYASTEANLVGIGVRDGWSVRLPDTGGQWAPNFASQTLLVEAVGSSSAEVEAKQSELVRRIGESLATMQREAGVDPVNSITVTTAPESTVTYHVGGSRIRALGMTSLLGAGATVSVAVLLERLARRKVESPLAQALVAETGPASAMTVPASSAPSR